MLFFVYSFALSVFVFLVLLTWILIRMLSA